METPTVALPPELSEAVATQVAAVAEVVAWDGGLPLPSGAADATVWVPAYPGGLDDAAIRTVLPQLPRLRVVQLLSAGVEPWPGLLPSGVTLCSGRSIHGTSTAELAVAGLLATIRDLPRYHEQQRNHDWSPHRTDTISGKQVLVLGAGDIAQHVHAVLTHLGAEVVVVARRAREGVLTMDDVPGLLPTVDAVIVALPHTGETAGLVDASFLGAMPDGAILVNVARGAIVDTDALTSELSAGRLRAVLDVTDPEPLPAEHPLWQLPDVLITPHVGGGASGWERRAQRLLVDQLTRLRKGEELRNVVTEGY